MTIRVRYRVDVRKVKRRLERIAKSRRVLLQDAKRLLADLRMLSATQDKELRESN